MPDGSATSHLYRPKLATVWSEGYTRAVLRHDLIAGLTVAIVALPLSMAIAVASGVSPDRGLYAAIVGGFFVSALGGSRFQIGGPAGAFIVLVAATVDKLGLEGLLLTVFVSGLMLVIVGLLRLGSVIRHVPQAVTVGFTAGIAATILASQLKELGGLSLVDEPGHVLPKLMALWHAFPTINPWSAAVGFSSATLIFLLRQWRPHWPGMLIAVVCASFAAFLLQLPIETVGSRFGGIPRGLPSPDVPATDLVLLLAVLPAAFTFTLLGGVESLLSAKVADGMTGRKHRYNMELVAQGVANVASAMFGGISVTGTIARTATNIRAGARTPFSGIFHAGFLLLFMLIAAPLASYIPLPALAGVLVVVAWNMVDRHELVAVLRTWPTAAVLVLTFALTLIQDLTFGIVGGCLLAAGIALTRRLFRAKAGS